MILTCSWELPYPGPLSFLMIHIPTTPSLRQRTGSFPCLWYVFQFIGVDYSMTSFNGNHMLPVKKILFNNSKFPKQYIQGNILIKIKVQQKSGGRTYKPANKYRKQHIRAESLFFYLHLYYKLLRISRIKYGKFPYNIKIIRTENIIPVVKVGHLAYPVMRHRTYIHHSTEIMRVRCLFCIMLKGGSAHRTAYSYHPSET